MSIGSLAAPLAIGPLLLVEYARVPVPQGLKARVKYPARPSLQIEDCKLEGTGKKGQMAIAKKRAVQEIIDTNSPQRRLLESPGLVQVWRWLTQPHQVITTWGAHALSAAAIAQFEFTLLQHAGHAVVTIHIMYPEGTTGSMNIALKRLLHVWCSSLKICSRMQWRSTYFISIAVSLS